MISIDRTIEPDQRPSINEWWAWIREESKRIKTKNYGMDFPKPRPYRPVPGMQVHEG